MLGPGTATNSAATAVNASSVWAAGIRSRYAITHTTSGSRSPTSTRGSSYPWAARTAATRSPCSRARPFSGWSNRYSVGGQLAGRAAASRRAAARTRRRGTRTACRTAPPAPRPRMSRTRTARGRRTARCAPTPPRPSSASGRRRRCCHHASTPASPSRRARSPPRARGRRRAMPSTSTAHSWRVTSASPRGAACAGRPTEHPDRGRVAHAARVRGPRRRRRVGDAPTPDEGHAGGDVERPLATEAAEPPAGAAVPDPGRLGRARCAGPVAGDRRRSRAGPPAGRRCGDAAGR